MKLPKWILTIYRHRRAELFYHPLGIIIHWVLRQPVVALIILFVCIYVSLAIGSAYLYMYTNKIWDSKDQRFISTFNEHLYFSFTTQSTLGYGDLAPRDSARLFTALQTTAGIVLTALGLSLIVTRIIRRSPKILFADIAYDKNSHELNFWFWNRDTDDLCNVEVNVILRRRLSLVEHPFLRSINYPLRLGKTAPLYVTSMVTIAVMTSSKDIDPKAPPSLDITHSTDPSTISVLSLRKDDELTILVNGISVDSGASIVMRKSYTLKDIKCGTFRHIMPGGIDTGNWRDRNYSNFNKLDPTPNDQRSKCDIINDCPLDDAVECRRRFGTMLNNTLQEC